LLEWTFVDDRDKFVGATIPQLHLHHQQWAAQAIKEENPNGKPEWLFTDFNSRYQYFIHVDEEVLRSVVYEAPHLPDDDILSTGYLNFVDAEWISNEERWGAEISGVDSDTPYDPIDGCTEYDVGWIRIAANMVGAGFYVNIGPALWHSSYRRPFELLDWWSSR